MAYAVDCGDKEMQILEAPESNVTLNDTERMELPSPSPIPWRQVGI